MNSTDLWKIPTCSLQKARQAKWRATRENNTSGSRSADAFLSNDVFIAHSEKYSLDKLKQSLESIQKCGSESANRVVILRKRIERSVSGRQPLWRPVTDRVYWTTLKTIYVLRINVEMILAVRKQFEQLHFFAWKKFKATLATIGLLPTYQGFIGQFVSRRSWVQIPLQPSIFYFIFRLKNALAEDHFILFIINPQFLSVISYYSLCDNYFTGSHWPAIKS